MTARVTAGCVALVKQFEGFRPRAYADIGGIPTIGYGHVVRPGEQFDTPLTEAQAADLLAGDLALSGERVLARVTTPLTDNQFSALVSLCFNVGTGPLAGTLGTRLNEGRYGEAADQFLRWVYAAGRKLPGLAARRAAERALFLTPP